VLGWIFLFGAARRDEGQEAAQEAKIEVDYGKASGTFPPVWRFFGYDEPNYTYAPNGKKLLQELAALSRRPVYIRVHNLFTTGDGSGSLKWGSTNVYTEDAAGSPVYDWTIVDRIFDTFTEVGVRPFVELGFMPQALSTHPEPYRHDFPHDPVGAIYTGWAYPPKDYQKWSELVSAFVAHLRNRYGDEAVKLWLWEVWNEPDIGYWKGTTEEYFKLYDYSVDAVLRAFPDAKIGGPDTTGAGAARAAEFLRLFLEHCTHQQNYANGKRGTRLDFISFHPKGSPRWVTDHVEMGLSAQLNSIEKGFEIISSTPEWRRIPVILGEWDPEGCAACSAEHAPQNSYRNGALYACYTAEALSRTLSLAEREHLNLEGLVTWAFEFEDQPFFAGFRELATNGIDKPVLNAFRMFGLMGEERAEALSSGARTTAEVVRSGVHGSSDVNVIATRGRQELAILVWNYHDIDIAAPGARIHVTVQGLPKSVRGAKLEHLRIDGEHSNAYTKWKEMGSPQRMDLTDQQELQDAGQLRRLDGPSWIAIEEGRARMEFAMPRESVSLIRLSW
jgi:xylan 1,4-beta-xylosidase